VALLISWNLLFDEDQWGVVGMGASKVANPSYHAP